jgi:hypothetical protein
MWSECQFIILVHRTLKIYQSKISPLSKLSCHHHDDTDFTIRHYFVLIPGQNYKCTDNLSHNKMSRTEN